MDVFAIYYFLARDSDYIAPSHGFVQPLERVFFKPFIAPPTACPLCIPICFYRSFLSFTLQTFHLIVVIPDLGGHLCLACTLFYQRVKPRTISPRYAPDWSCVYQRVSPVWTLRDPRRPRCYMPMAGTRISVPRTKCIAGAGWVTVST